MKQINLTVYEKNDLIRLLDYARMKKIEECTEDNQKLIEFDLNKIEHLRKVLNDGSRADDYSLQSTIVESMEGANETDSTF